MMIWLLRIFSVIALIGFAAAVWFAGPLIGLADARPLEAVWLRTTIIGSVIAMVAAYYLFRFGQMRKRHRALEAAVTSTADQDSEFASPRSAHDRGPCSAQAVERQAQLALRTTVVHRHRPTGGGQNDGDRQLRPEVSIGRFE